MRTRVWLAAGLCGLVAMAAPAAPPRGKAKTAPVVKPPVVKRIAPPAVSPAPMWGVAWSPDGARLAVGTYRRVLFFDAQTGAKVGDYPVSTEAIRAVAFSPDGKLLAAATGVPGQSGGAIVLDTSTGKPVRNIKSHDDTVEAVAWAGGILLTAANDEKVCVTEAATGRQVGTLSEHIGRCLSVAVPTATTPADGGDIWATGGADKAVKIWDARLRRVVVNFDQSTGAVWCLAATPRPGMFLAGCDDGKVRIFRVRQDGARRANTPADEPDGRTGYLDRTLDAADGAVYAVAASPDSKWLASGGADGKVVLWTGGGNRRKVMTEATRDIWGVAFSPDSRRVAAASLDGTARVYDTETGALLFAVGAAPVAPGTTSPAPPNKP